MLFQRTKQGQNRYGGYIIRKCVIELKFMNEKNFEKKFKFIFYFKDQCQSRSDLDQILIVII